MWIKLITFLLVTPALAGAYYLGSNAFFLETAQYDRLQQDRNFEIREYPDLAVASTTTQSDGDSSAFGKLFRFIQGGNSREEKIAMTTPVFIDEGQMSFMIPKQLAVHGIPDPNDEAVTIHNRPGIRVAVYRFSGFADDQKRSEALQKLTSWMGKRDLVQLGDPSFAYYDAPFVPGPLRRNEVMFKIK